MRRMRKRTGHLLLSLALSGALLLSGCIRVMSEVEFAQKGGKPQRYGRCTLHMGIFTYMMLLMAVLGNDLNLMGSRSEHSLLKGLMERVMALGMFSVCLADLSLEVVADVLCLPADLTRSAMRRRSPPLTVYCRQKDYEGMRRLLEQGADPNEPDPYEYMHNALDMALWQKDVQAYRLLLAYGGRPVRPVVISGCSRQTAEIIRISAEHGWTEEELKSKWGRRVIRDWLEHHLKFEVSSSEDDGALADIVITLLEAGFPPEGDGADAGSRDPSAPPRTALDLVLDNLALETEAKDRLAVALRAHGVTRAGELEGGLERDELTRLHDEAVTVDMRFRPVVELLRQSRKAAGFALSEGYPGVDGPALVIEQASREYGCLYREVRAGTLRRAPLRTVFWYHRRQADGVWDQRDERLEVPTGFRMVLTPHGVRVPPLCPAGVPEGLGLREAHYTLPTCELTLQRKARLTDLGPAGASDRPDMDLLRVCLLALGRQDDRELVRRLALDCKRADPAVVSFLSEALALFRYARPSPGLQGMVNIGLVSLSQETRQLASRVGAWLAAACEPVLGWTEGRVEQWSSMSLGSTCRDLTEVAEKTRARSLRSRWWPGREENLPSLVPLPGEVIVALRDGDGRRICSGGEWLASREGRGYWNCRQVPGRHEVWLYFADDVPSERLDAIQRALERGLARERPAGS